MKNDKTQNDTQGLASLFVANNGKAYLKVDDFILAEVWNDRERTIPDCKELVARYNSAPALAASHCALVAALESALETITDLSETAANRSSMADARDNATLLLRMRDHGRNGVKAARKALSDARNLTAGMEGGSR